MRTLVRNGLIFNFAMDPTHLPVDVYFQSVKCVTRNSHKMIPLKRDQCLKTENVYSDRENQRLTRDCSSFFIFREEALKATKNSGIPPALEW